MSTSLTYGIVFDGVFYSKRMQLRVGEDKSNGIYCVDMEVDDFRETLTFANIDDAIRAFRKMSKIQIIRGVSFHDGIVPENPVAYKHIPIRVVEPGFEEFEEVEVALFREHCFFLQTVTTDKSFGLLDMRDAIREGRDISLVTGVPPEVRIVGSLHVMEQAELRRQEELTRIEAEQAVEAERRRALMAQPINAIRAALEYGGATVLRVQPIGDCFEAIWECAGHRISTLVDRNLNVRQGGFCMSDYDHTQSARSLPKLLEQYVEDGDYIYRTRAVDSSF